MKSVILSILLMVSPVSAEPLQATVVRVYDGDTITVDIPGWPELVGDNISIRVDGVDTPEIRGKTEREKALAIIARDEVRKVIPNGSTVCLTDCKRGKYFRLICGVETIDGIDLTRYLINGGYGIPYHGGKRKDW